MPITANTVWRNRAGGSDLNGGGYDATLGPSVDYTQQDAPVLSLTDLASTASTTITSATGGFTSAMKHNHLCLPSGSGVTVGYYRIVDVVTSNQITVERASGTYTGISGRVGGAVATLRRILENTNAVGDKVVAGNTIYIRGSGSWFPVSNDFVASTYISAVSGTTSARISIIGENGRPRIQTEGLFLYQTQATILRNCVFVSNSGTLGSLGIFSSASTGNTGSHIDNCYFNLNNKAGLSGVLLSNGYMTNTEIDGGTISPVLSADSYGVILGNYSGHVLGCNIHHCRNHGIYSNSAASGGVIQSSLINLNAGDGLKLDASSNTVTGSVSGNVVNGNAGHAVSLSRPTLSTMSMFNNLFTNHTTSGKYAIYMSSGTLAENDALRCFIDYNAYWNNAGDVSNISKGANDITCSADPYTAYGTDFTLNGVSGGGLALRDGGYPQTFAGMLSTLVYKPIGFYGTPTGGGGLLVHPGMVGV